MKVYWGLYPVILLLLVSPVFGAVIHGAVYDLDLNKVSQAVVEINTSPKQVMVSVNGTYSFEVPIGNYELSARHAKLDMSVVEIISVTQDGAYVLDLLLFPDFSEEDELLNETLDVIEYEEYEGNGNNTLLIAVLVVVAFIIGFMIFWKVHAKPTKEEKEEPKEVKKASKADLEEILAFVKKEGGRTTQKDLRKAIPYSEAKISLMIAELESQGRLKKIKKGRGNIIIIP